MKSTFSRTFYPAAVILMAALLLVGASVQVLIKDYLAATEMADMRSDGAAIADLAVAYGANHELDEQEFLIHLSMAGKVSGADVVICDTTGQLLVCSDAPLGCSHQGLTINQNYLKKVLSAGNVSGSGVIEGLYTENRYVVAQTIQDADNQIKGIVILSKPLSQTAAVLRKLSNVYLYAALLAILISMVLMTVLVRRHSCRKGNTSGRNLLLMFPTS